MKFLIICTEPGGKTSRVFDRMGVDYEYVACSCSKAKFEGFPTRFYECCGKHGSNIARRNALEMGDCVVFDDDYESFVGMGMFGSGISTIKIFDKDLFRQILEGMKEIEKRWEKVIVGGYSAGAPCGVENRAKQNIMQIFLSGKIEKFFRKDSDLYRNNDDVCACIMAKRRGYATYGLWSIIRAVQTPEGKDNTNRYDKRSYAKSFLPVLYAPTCAKVVWCSEKRLSGGKIRPGRFHHKIDWIKLTPKMVERSKDGK